MAPAGELSVTNGVHTSTEENAVLAGKDKSTPLQAVPPIAHPTPESAFGIAANIKYHAQYTPHFSPYKFEPEQAFYATAESVRDSLIHVSFTV